MEKLNKEMKSIEITNILYQELNNYILKKDVVPSIVDISIGDDFGGLMYSKMKKKKIQEKTPISFKSLHLENIDLDMLCKCIDSLNYNEEITGIMLQLPLPSNLREYEREVLDLINVKKDIDGLTTESIGNLSIGKDSLVPCTALGIEVLLKIYGVDLEGKNVAIINRSNIVGKPLALLMLKDNATPVICHSKTKDLASVTSNCDIVVAALNKKEYITSEYIKDGAIVIDVGVHKNELGKTVGDVNYNDVYDKVSLITPPTGAVGPMTICMLAYNSAKSLYGSEVNDVLKSAIDKAKILVKKV